MAQEWYRTFWEPENHPLPTAPIKARYEQLTRWAIHRLDHWLGRKAHIIVTTSAYNAQHISRSYGREPLVVPLGVNTRFYKPKQRLKKAGYFLFVGENDEIHGYPLVKEALELSPHKIKVKVVSFKGKELDLREVEMRDLYQGATAVLCLDKAEPFGLVAVEAMSCGTPVIGICEGGYAETVSHNETGLLIGRSGKALYLAMVKLASDENLRQLLGKNARTRAIKHYGLERVSKRWSAILTGGK
jgi:glycosyltransferase involved in cell wall biosynthesis